MMTVSKPKTPVVIDLTKESSDSQRATLKIPHIVCKMCQLYRPNFYQPLVMMIETM